MCDIIYTIKMCQYVYSWPDTRLCIKVFAQACHMLGEIHMGTDQYEVNSDVVDIGLFVCK
jgi:hypothetical protein